jgi:hypothetical protein
MVHWGCLGGKLMGICQLGGLQSVNAEMFESALILSLSTLVRNGLSNFWNFE